jgi:photosystem II PsbT protein|uniref:Photosystem II reaction center protein T n=1 Tax=Cyanothece sp. (strain PCC 7425 / ATCC 29141) TaxID=395961 RepID=PSBT_CYAP4|nr:RecName: Full=Photosystem II reaction center protein T; Short=PSII-T [Cyanothece sp. PCC 7425]
MESIAYVLIFACLIGLFFFAIFFREPPRITKK